MTEDELKAIEARANAARPGPWKKLAAETDTWLFVDGPVGNITSREYWHCEKEKQPTRAQDESDFDFIAHAREDIPALIAEVRRLRGIINHRGCTLGN